MEARCHEKLERPTSSSLNAIGENKKIKENGKAIYMMVLIKLSLNKCFQDEKL